MRALHRASSRRALAIALVLGLALTASAGLAATITIVNVDGAGEGFNDPTPAAPVGGNPGVTIGQQRLNVFQTAADIWGAILPGSVQIRVQSAFDPLTCTATSAVLGSAGPMIGVPRLHRRGVSRRLVPRGARQPAGRPRHGSDRQRHQRTLQLQPGPDDLPERQRLVLRLRRQRGNAHRPAGGGAARVGSRPRLQHDHERIDRRLPEQPSPPSSTSTCSTGRPACTGTR